METKSRVRKELLKKRNEVSKEEQISNSRLVCDKLLKMEWYEESNLILVYAAIRNELSLDSFIEQAWKDGKKLYFPKVNGQDMEFYRADAWNELESGCFGVLEPHGDIERILPNQIVTKTPMFVPGVAFSTDGQRIGYGKGYYDRYLAAKHKNICIEPIGIAYAFQVTEPWKNDEFDYPMSYIVTEKE